MHIYFSNNITKNRNAYAYKEVSLVQFPMKSGIFPEKGLSVAHLVLDKPIYGKLSPAN